MNQKNFLERAEQLGHSLERLQKGHKISTVISVPNVEELKALLDDGSNEESKQLKSSRLFDGISDEGPEARILKKVYSYVYGNGSLDENDHKELSHIFPIDVLATSAADETYKGWKNLGVSQLNVIVNIGTLTMEDQSYVTVQNSTLTFTVDKLIRQGSAPAGKADFSVLGLAGKNGGIADKGEDGGKGDDGKGGNCSSAGIAGDSGQNGVGGGTGKVGNTGPAGTVGLPSMPAIINIKNSLEVNGQFTILSESGSGGAGGVGGVGGKGGKGGKGGDGASCGCTGSGAGNGATGGTGGDGGVGGKGANGADAAGNVIVNVHSDYLSKVQGLKKDPIIGLGGYGGAGGAGGDGGGKGSGGKHNSNGSDGSKGGSGNKGAIGGDGTYAGKSAVVDIRAY